MKILLVDVDDTDFPNLALKKVEKYYKDKGDEIVWNWPIYALQADKIYISCVFTWNRGKITWYERKSFKDKVFIGGSGYDLHVRLPDEIESIKPKINYGFTTRGCIRKCKFCVVPEKEGKIQVIGDIYDLWDGKSKDIVIMDNNILASGEHFDLICKQIKKEKLRVDFNQGLDCRLMNDETAQILKGIRHIEYRFSFDTLQVEKDFKKVVALFDKYELGKSMWYVIVGFDTTIEEDLYRLNMIRASGHDAYVQRFNKKEKVYIPLARWANQHNVFSAMSFNDFLHLIENKKYLEMYKNLGIQEIN